MDYLDLKKEFRHRIVLFVGYALIGVAITIATLVLLYNAYGFTLKKDGTVIQNGVNFFSSHPNPADIYANGKLQPAKTNTRLILPSGIYQMKLAREGYHDWQRLIEVHGGKVQHFDYPFLFPKSLSPKKLHSFSGQPGLLTQSLDRRWLLIQQPGKLLDFLLYDLNAPTDPPASIGLPATLLSPATQSQTLQVTEWAGDNRHLLLEHAFDDKSESIIIDRDDLTLSVNLNTTLGLAPTASLKFSLQDKKYDKYYVFDSANARLQAITLKAPSLVTVLDKVKAFKTYGNDTVLYVTENGAAAGQANLKLKIGKQTVTVRRLPASSSYVLNLTKYDGVLYVAAGANGGSRVYVYKDPTGQVDNQPNRLPVPAQVLHVEQPNYVSFSTNAQYIVAENGTRFGVYDIENEAGYNYTTTQPLDGPQVHSSWMDGNRLLYVTGSKLLVFDYDNLNQQTLMPAGSAYLPAFTPNFKFVYNLAPTADGFDLQQTSLLVAADQ